jgi:hypothetical protein
VPYLVLALRSQFGNQKRAVRFVLAAFCIDPNSPDRVGRCYTCPNHNPLKKTVGDVDFESVHEVAGWITPVPGGVGPVTLAMLIRNTVAAVERTKMEYEKAMLA